MIQLLSVVFFLAVIMVAPIKAAAAFLGGLLLATLVVQSTTSAISRVKVTLGESFKAIVFSLLFWAVAASAVISFQWGSPRDHVSSLSGLVLGLMQYSAYVLGFRIALGLTWMHAAMVAVASTVMTFASIWFIVKMDGLS